MKNRPVTGFLIAGGKSTRMKTDKGFVKYKGISLAQYSLQILSNFCQKVYINSNNPRYERFGIEVITDSYLDKGPLGGILTCLEITQTELNLFLPVDTPNISNEIIETLLHNSNNSDIIVPVKNNYVEPLIGIYKSSCQPLLAKFLKENKLKLVDILKESNTCYVNIDKSLNFYDENMFYNINSPDDLK